MNELTLEWTEANQIRSETLNDRQQTKYPGVVRLGRDPSRCDIVLSHPTVSGLHVEIDFDPQHPGFCLRNLRDTNPPIVNGQYLTQGQVVLRQGIIIVLGQIEVKVTAVALDGSIPPTQLFPPPVPEVTPDYSARIRRAEYEVTEQPAYGLQCPQCQRIVAFDRPDLGCPWCGTSLAAAGSVVIEA
jgi:hypothetical protein